MYSHLIIGTIPLWFVFAGAARAQNDAEVFRNRIKPFLETHCVDCHGDTTKKAGLSLHELKPNFGDADIARHWINVHDKLVRGEMPPAKRERPGKQELHDVTRWLHAQLHQVSLANHTWLPSRTQ